MDFYDLAYPAALRGAVSNRLDFKRIYEIGKDIGLVDLEGEKGNVADSLCIGRSGEILCAAAKQSPRAILIRDFRIDRKLIGIMEEREVALCIGLDAIIESKGINRSRTIYMISKLIGYAMKKKIEVAFVSLAKSEEMLCSPIQMIELAKLLGASEAYARDSIGKTNSKLAIR